MERAINPLHSLNPQCRKGFSKGQRSMSYIVVNGQVIRIINGKVQDLPDLR